MVQLFHDVRIDWLAKAKYFIAGSLLLLLAGIGSWVSQGSLHYGIDFKGGTLVYVRFAERPQVEKIRQTLSARGLGNASIQEIRDLARPDANEVVIGLEQQGDTSQALDAGKAAILAALSTAFSTAEAGKQDFNAARPEDLAEVLARRDALALGPAAGDRYTQLGRALAEFRDAERGGLVTDFAQLRGVEGVSDGVLAALRDRFFLGQYAVRNVEIVGPKVGEALRRQAVVVTLYALAGMLVYIAFRFEWVYGAAAVIAVFHDVLITLGFFSLFQFEISLTVIAALLTLVGYSMNDTIVIFDRIRENLRLMRREPFEAVVNRSINQTLSRTVLTSGLTFLTVLVLFLLGGEVLRSFAFALVVGVVVGTYSSVGIAAPIVVFWYRRRGGRGLAVPAVTPKGAA
jgi:preprotein translocase subunit SecF